MKSDYTPGPSACGSCTGFLVSHHSIVCISIGWSFGESKNSLLLPSFNLLMMQRQTETDEIRLRVLDRQRYTFNGFFCGLSIGTHSLWWQPSANDMFWLLSILHTFESPFLFRHLAPHILNIIERNTSSLRNINGKVREALPPLYRPCPICMTSQLPLSPAPDFLNEFRFRKGNHIRRHSFTCMAVAHHTEQSSLRQFAAGRENRIDSHRLWIPIQNVGGYIVSWLDSLSVFENKSPSIGALLCVWI